MNLSKSETKLRLLAIVVATVLILALGCASAAATLTPVAPAAPAPAVAPTAASAPAPTAAPVAASPTPVQMAPAPTATRVLPTSTPMVTGKARYGGSIRYVGVNLDTLDPHMNVLAGEVFSMLWGIYDQLVHLNANGDLVPELAERWDISPDGKTITLYIRKDVRFHDGTPLNAEAVRWNFNRMLDPNENSPRRAELAPFVERVEAVDELTLRLRLFAPLRPFLATLGSDRVGFIVSPTAVKKYGKDYGRNPVGAGAFTFAEWVLESRVVMKRNGSYWDKGRPYLDEVRFVAGGDESVNLALLRTGEVEMIESIRPGDLPIVEANPNLNSGRLAGYRTTALHFNPSKPPFDNWALRQAIAYALDSETFAKIAYPGQGRRVYVLERLGAAYNPDLKPIAFNLAKAKEKLKEAGFPNGVTIVGSTDPGERLTETEVVQAILAKAGINMEIKIFPTSDMFHATKGFYVNQGFAPTSSMARRTDPHINLQRYFHSKGGNNYSGGYKNSEVDRLIEEAATVYDTAKARQLYSRMQQIIVGEDAVHIPFAERDVFNPHNKSVQGYVPRIHGRTILREMWLEK